MKTLTYYVAFNSDSQIFNIRGKTRKECLAKLFECKGYDKKDYTAPFKVVVEYESPLDLINKCLDEGGLWDEDSQHPRYIGI